MQLIFILSVEYIFHDIKIFRKGIPMQAMKTHLTGLAVTLLSVGVPFAQSENQDEVYEQPQQHERMPHVPTPDEISDGELTTFVEASDAIQPIQQKAQEDVQQVILDEGMELERFQEIMIAMQNPQAADQVEISSEEEQTLQSIQPQLMDIEMEATEDIRTAIADRGLNIERYQAIFMSLQQHPELMQRLESLMSDG